MVSVRKSLKTILSIHQPWPILGLIASLIDLMEIISKNGLFACRCFSIEKNNGTMSIIL
jgi:hypothetical protein